MVDDTTDERSPDRARSGERFRRAPSDELERPRPESKPRAPAAASRWPMAKSTRPPTHSTAHEPDRRPSRRPRHDRHRPDQPPTRPTTLMVGAIPGEVTRTGSVPVRTATTADVRPSVPVRPARTADTATRHHARRPADRGRPVEQLEAEHARGRGPAGRRPPRRWPAVVQPAVRRRRISRHHDRAAGERHGRADRSGDRCGRRTGRRSGRRPGRRQPTGPATITAVTAFDPDGDNEENDADAALALRRRRRHHVVGDRRATSRSTWAASAASASWCRSTSSPSKPWRST